MLRNRRERATERAQIRRASTAVGFLITAFVVVTNIPENPFLDLRRHRPTGFILSHSGVLLLMWGTAPRLRGRLLRLAVLTRGAQALRLTAAVMLLLVSMIALILVAPRVARNLLVGELGLVEPLQCAMYLIAGWLSAQIASLLTRGDPAASVYRTGRSVGTCFALVEAEFLGVPFLVAAALGESGKRMWETYLVTVDALVGVLADPVYRVGAVAVTMVFTAPALAWLGRRYGGVLIRELASWASVPLAVAAIFMGLSQIGESTSALRGRLFFGVPIRRFLEEPMELLAVACLTSALVLKFSERYTRASPN